MIKILIGFVAIGLLVGAVLWTASTVRNNLSSQDLVERAVRGPGLLAQDKNISIILTGDVMLGRTVEGRSVDEFGDPAWPLRKVAETLTAADLVFINLENPIIENCPRHSDGFKFCANPVMIAGLKLAGVDIANLANNHTLNYGQSGLSETERYLNETGMNVTGSGLVIREVNGVRFGFLGFDFVAKSPNDADFKTISEATLEVDILTVAVHWGVEYTSVPTAKQRAWGRRMVEAGADVIAGHHPHWVQPWEYVPGKDGSKKVVFWSLGNFVFDQMWSEETRKGLAVKLNFRDKELVSVEEMPVYMKEWAQPEWVN